MRAYELMVIFDGDLEDNAYHEEVKALAAQLEGTGAAVANTDTWGKRRFAYEIDHKVEGYYAVLELTSDGVDLSPVERSLRLADQVVRHKLIRLPDAEAARRGLFGDAEAEPAAAG